MQIAPGNGLPAMNLAAELLKRGQYDKAYAILQDLIRRLPANLAVNYDLGLLFYRVHDYAQAETYLARAARYDVANKAGQACSWRRRDQQGNGTCAQW